MQGGEQLSQGERRLLTIARAVLTDAPLLILDEATSSADTVTEQRIRKAMLDTTRGRISIIIAHRLSTIFRMKNLFCLPRQERLFADLFANRLSSVPRKRGKSIREKIAGGESLEPRPSLPLLIRHFIWQSSPMHHSEPVFGRVLLTLEAASRPKIPLPPFSVSKLRRMCGNGCLGFIGRGIIKKERTRRGSRA